MAADAAPSLDTSAMPKSMIFAHGCPSGPRTRTMFSG
jgi:hypothetical protein